MNLAWFLTSPDRFIVTFETFPALHYVQTLSEFVCACVCVCVCVDLREPELWSTE